MKAVVLARAAMEHQCKWGAAFCEGLRRHGWQAEVSNAHTPPSCDMLVMWGVRNQTAIAEQKRRGGEVCIVERGYMGDRFKYSSVSFGGWLNGRGIYRGPMTDGSRLRKHFAHLLKPWRTQPGYALLVGQVPGDASLAGKDLSPWYLETARKLQADGREVVFKPHPVAVERGYRGGVPGVHTLRATLEDALSGAMVAVTWNSNTAVDAVLSGVPAVAIDKGSMAYEVAGHTVVKVMTPDRTAWATALAWKQWTRDEMASGECWAAVGAS